MPQDLIDYIEHEILPRYATFDAAHRIDHARMVIEQSLQLVETINNSTDYVDGEGRKLYVSPTLAYVIAAYHDTGLCEGREHHHTASARIIRSDAKLRRWFSPAEIDLMADAAEDHRASAKSAPRTIYGRIVAEADRFIDPVTIIRRTVQYGLDHYPEISVDEHYRRTVEHLREKYGDGGYLHLWFADSPNAARLEALRVIIRQADKALPQLFAEIWADLTHTAPQHR